MEIKSFVTGPLATNTYLVTDDVKMTHYIVDPAAFGSKMEFILNHLKYDISFIFITHGHVDHIAGIPFLKKQFPNTKIILSKEDFDLYNKADMQSAMFGLPSVSDLPEPDILIEKEISVECFDIFKTPGHSKGSLCFYNKENQIIFTGDLIFMESIGRTDFWGGSLKNLIKSVKEKILVLPDHTVLLSGHGPKTTVKHEKQYNPFLS